MTDFRAALKEKKRIVIKIGSSSGDRGFESEKD